MPDDDPNEQAVPQYRIPSQVLAENVRAHRERVGLSQRDLAERMTRLLGHLERKWYATTVGEVERGKRSVSVDELWALAMALSTYVLDLLDPEAGPQGPMAPPLNLGVPELLPMRLSRTLLSSRNPLFTMEWRGNEPQNVVLQIMYGGSGQGEIPALSKELYEEYLPQALEDERRRLESAQGATDGEREGHGAPPALDDLRQ